METVKKILNLLLALAFLFWSYAFVSDCLRVNNGGRAKYCVKDTVYDQNDGSTEECLGLGYKVYYYNRSSVDIAKEIGPFWMAMR